MAIARSIVRVVTICLLLTLLASCAAVAGSPFTLEEQENALNTAWQYVNLEHEYDGQQRKGVAYLLGGQDTVQEYLQKIEQGAKPGEEAGIDASGLIVNVYRAVYPNLQFVYKTEEGQEVRVRDVSSETLYRWNVQPVEASELRPGDLIFFNNSSGRITGVALYEGRRGDSIRIIVASYSAGKVVETGIRFNGDYWKSRVAGAGRLIKQ